MTEFKRVKINNILDSQIPEFLNEEYPLFKNFLTQYYISQEHQTGVTDLASNLNNYKKIENFNNETFIDLQLPSVLLQNVLSFDDTILVSHTIGFPDKYGLVKINDDPESLVKFSLSHPGNDEYFPNGILRRKPFHMCVWNRNIACSVEFPNISLTEDWMWLEQLCKIAKTEVFIDSILHKYVFNSKETTSNW
jgi:hypothetical protein